jgi:hypothetical protein
MFDITFIIEAVITIVVFVVGTYLIPWIKQKIGGEKTNELLRWVGIFVRAAEQIYRESGMGVQKKAYVVEKLQEKGYSLDMEAIDEMIEAAVLELNREAAA